MAVDSHTTVDGKELPRVIHWDDGKKFVISDILRTINRSHAKVGGTGTCYQCQFENGALSNLFHEVLEDANGEPLGARWFVEEKVDPFTRG